MKKFALVLAFFLASLAQGAVLAEQSFQQLNVPIFSAEGPGTPSCQDYSFAANPNQDANIFAILSLHAVFSPTSGGKATISVQWNEFSTSLATEDFYNGAWARITIPKENLKAMNDVKICATPSNSVSKIQILTDSKLGTYYSPQFVFSKRAENPAPLVGKEVKVVLEAKNVGSEKAKTEIRYRSTELGIVQISRGDAEFSGTIEPGQTVRLEYFVIPKFAVQMTLPPARLFFENVFGETIVQKSSLADLNVQKPSFPIQALIQTDKPVYQAGEIIHVTVVASNQESEDYDNVQFVLTYTNGLSNPGDEKFSLPFSAQESKSASGDLKAVLAGEQAIGCQISIPEEDAVGNCDSKSVKVEIAPDLNYLYVGLILLVIGGIVYVFIHFAKPAQ